MPLIIVHVRLDDIHIETNTQRTRKKERLGKVGDAYSMIGTLLKLKVRINEGDLLALSTRANSNT